MAEDKSVNKLLTYLSLLLMAGAVIFWLVWGIVYNGWNMFDKNYMGVYAIFVVMFLLGLFGFLLIRVKEKAEVASK